MDEIYLDKELLGSLRNVNSFSDLYSVLLQILDENRSRTDVMPFAKAYASLLLDSDVYFSGGEEAEKALYCSLDLQELDQTSLKNNSDPSIALIKECISCRPQEVLLNHCNTYKDLLKIIESDVPRINEEGLKESFFADKYAETFWALMDRAEDAGTGFIEVRDALDEMKLNAVNRDRMTKLYAEAPHSKRDMIIFIIVALLFIAFCVHEFLNK